MAAGKYRHRAVFQGKVEGAKDQYGNPTGGTWPDLFEAPGWLRETPGKEAIAAGRLETTVTGTLRVQASPSSPAHGVTPADRVQVGGHTWKILAGPVDPDGRGRVVEFTLERGGAVQ